MSDQREEQVIVDRDTLSKGHGGVRIHSGRFINVVAKRHDDPRPEKFRDNPYEPLAALKPSVKEPDLSGAGADEVWEDPKADPLPQQQDGPPLANWCDNNPPQEQPAFELSPHDDPRPEQGEKFRDDLYAPLPALTPVVKQPDLSGGGADEVWEDPKADPLPQQQDGPPLANWCDNSPPREQPEFELSPHDDPRPEQGEKFRDDLYAPLPALKRVVKQPDLSGAGADEVWEDPKADPLPANVPGPSLHNWTDGCFQGNAERTFKLSA